MKKPNLVIDKEQNKVFLDGEVLGIVQMINLYDRGEYVLKINYNNLYKLSGFNFDNIFESGFIAISVELKDEMPLYLKWLDNFIIYFQRHEFARLNLYVNIVEWDYSFNFLSLFEKLKEGLEKDSVVSEAIYNINRISRISLKLNLELLNEYIDIPSLVNFIDHRLSPKILEIIEFSINDSKDTKKNIIIPFTFPPEIQSSCEQYLIYFATFLKDIGINAETNIESKAQSTLFTVIPDNGEEALGKIKEALSIYLSLPEMPNFENAANEFTDVSIQKLASQVYFYKSQLALANTMLQLKDEKIESLNMMNYQETVIVESHQIEEKNEEKVLGGLVTITEFKLNGLTVNSPEMVRFLKRLFSRKL